MARQRVLPGEQRRRPARSARSCKTVIAFRRQRTGAPQGIASPRPADPSSATAGCGFLSVR